MRKWIARISAMFSTAALGAVTAAHSKDRGSVEAIVAIVKAVINESDPEGVGSDPVEYDIEVAPIASFIFTFRYDLHEYRAEAIKYVNRVWALYFDHDCSRADQIVDRISQEVSSIPKPAGWTDPMSDPEFKAAMQRLNQKRLQLFGLGR